MPAQAKLHEFLGAAVLAMVLDKVEPGAEMIARAGKDHRAHPGSRQKREKRDQFFDRLRIKRVAFLRAVERHLENAVFLRLKRQIFKPEGMGIKGHGVSPLRRSGCIVQSGQACGQVRKLLEISLAGRAC